MRWYQDVAWFFAGAFVCHAVPHFVIGVRGIEQALAAGLIRFRGRVAEQSDLKS
jgi:hypothetical protein